MGTEAPAIDKLRLFYNHPGFIEAMADLVIAALGQLPAERRAAAELIYTAHSLPAAMARHAPYEHQLREACRLVTERRAACGFAADAEFPRWQLVFQSRSGPPEQPWLAPDIRDRLGGNGRRRPRRRHRSHRIPGGKYRGDL